ncbi:cytochrome b/b6 domain-containing protein [Roseovarius sp. B08]|uniref:cytochrome b/b6 domain-containing protein n=1 Tax=Roseovarius sp. B08 TaxID=3449223 RepID=UPI003EDBB387
MPLTNSPDRYGAVTKTFHWLTALLILSAIPLGLIANDLAHAVRNPDIATTEAEISRAAFLFSLHKTIGVTVFFVALLRILWTIGQTKPGLLNGDKPLEARAAETVHWLLYGSLVAVPLTGWIHHAATTGFAPIWWPFGQSLPLVPKDGGLAHTFASLHHILNWVLWLSLAAHVAGALKHHVIDRDATLRRMLPGRTTAKPTARQPGHAFAALAALLIWAAALGTGGALGYFSHDTETAQTAEAETAEPITETASAKTDTPAPTETAENAWTVTDGTLGLTVVQMGSEVEGQFEDWTAKIVYDEDAGDDGKHGTVDVTVTIASLTLGSVTSDAKGPDYLAAETHHTATFSADLVSRDGGHVATGALTIKGNSVPVEMPFDLNIDGNTATASGGLTVDRRDFGVGGQSEGNVGASVEIRFDLTAER